MADLIILAQLENRMNRLFLPLGLLYLADSLEKRGEEVYLFHDHGNRKNIDLLVHMVELERPDWVGFSVITGPPLVPTIEASKRIKAETGCKVIWGGMHPTMVDGVEHEPYVDVAVKGEGEAWVSGRPVKDMDEFQPAWHLIDAERYGSKIHLITSRGCIYRCGFCYSPSVWKRRWKTHSVEKVLEIFHSYTLEPEMIEFRDDYFFTNKKRAIEIVNRLDTSWMSTIRANDLTSELLDSLDVLPESLSMGVESASQRLLDLIHKDITIQDVYSSLGVAEKYGVNLYLTFIVGLPTETEEEREATVRLAHRLEREYKNVTCNIKKYRCYPGTALYALSVKEGFKPPRTTEEWAEYAMSVWR